ncbi:hypothetical protein [Methylobacterium sp. A54F]
MTHPEGHARRAAALASVCALALLAGSGLAPGWGPGSALITPARAQEAAFAVQDVTLADVALPLGATLLRAPRLTVSGTRLSKDDLLAILRPDAPEPWATRLARLDAASLTIPELRSEHAGAGPARQVVVYRDVTARDVRAGRIAELTASGAAITVTGGRENGSGTYGAVHATGLDLTALARLYGVAGDGKGPVQQVYSGVSVADVVYTDDGGTTVKLARLEGRDLGGRQVPGGWSGALEAATRGAPEDAAPAERTRAAGAAADLIEAAALGSLEATGLSVSETRGKAPVLFEAARMAYAGAGPEASVSLDGLAFAQGGLRVQAGRAALSGFSLAPTVATLRRLAAPDAKPAEDDLRRLAPAMGTLTLKDIGIDLPREEAAAPGLPLREARPAPRGRESARDPLSAAIAGPPKEAGRPEPGKPDSGKADSGKPDTGKPDTGKAEAPKPVHVGLREAAFTFGAPQDGVPSAGRFALTGLSLPAATVATLPGLGALSAFGYRDLDLDLVADTAWDEARRELSVREISLAGRDMGTVRLTGTLGGIGPELFDPDGATAGLAMLSATAKALDLTIENSGLFERFIDAQSKVLSLKPDELRREYVTASVLGVPVILGNSPAARAIGAAMGKFVTKPGRLTVTAKAKDAGGFGFAEFGTAGSPAAVLDRLDVDARAE